MYEVFFNDRTVFIGSTFKKSLTDSDIVVEVNNNETIISALNKFLQNDQQGNLYLLTADIEATFNFFKGMFTIVVAAGGVVKNKSGKLLCIYRFGKWDLPKGKLEKGENIEEAAVREVSEECGINGIELNGLNCVTYHIYQNPKKTQEWILKPTYWFNMNYFENEELIPQFEEGIQKAQWIDKKDLAIVFENTWQSLKSVFKSFSNFE